MSQRSNTPLLVLLVLLALGGGAAIYFGLQPSDVPASTAAGPGDASPAVVETELAGPDRSAIRAVDGVVKAEPGSTTVAWPVQLWLEQISSEEIPAVDGVAPLGTGRRARLDGRVITRGGGVGNGTVEFIGGPNGGRVLQMNELGEFGATDLYPGLNIVRVQGAGLPGSVREVRLRTSKGEVLNIGYDLPGTMIGTVFGPDGEPLEGVEVACDGQRTKTNEDGLFYYPEMSGGTNLVLTLEKPGYARHFQVVGVGSGRQMAKDRYTFRLRREAVLEIAVSSAAGGPGKTQVIILPANTQVARNFPWWEVSPAMIEPGRSLVIEGLPPVKVALRSFHAGAVANPADRRVNLRAGARALEEIHLEPGPKIHGIVRDAEGRAVPNARVALEAPDRIAATMFHLKEMPYFLETEVVPTFPVASQDVATDSYGRYTLTDYTAVAPGLYLTAESPDGSAWSGQVLREGPGGDRELDLVLEARAANTGRVELEFPGRVQGTPVEVAVDGEPIDPGVVPLGQPLVLEDLAAGTWHLMGSWNGVDLFEGRGYHELRIGSGGARALVHLPEGAIHGQDADTLSRAGQRP